MELYIAAQRVTGIRDGLYHYLPVPHQLECLAEGALQPALPDLVIGQDMIGRANLVIIISGVFRRTMWKYGQRGYRYVGLDAGHVAQNLYLVATALDQAVVSIGGFFDSELHELLNLDEDERPLYLICVGQKPPVTHPTRRQTSAGVP